MHEQILKVVHETHTAQSHLGDLCLPCDEIKHFITVGLIVCLAFFFVCLCTYAGLKRFEHKT